MFQNIFEDDIDPKQETATSAKGDATEAAPLNSEAEADTEERGDTGDGSAGDDGSKAAASSRKVLPEAADDAKPADDATGTGNTGIPQTPGAILGALKVELEATSDLVVENVEEVESAKPTIDKRRSLLLQKGLTEAMIDEILPIMSTTRKTQRQLPVDSTVCSSEMIAFFDGRDDTQITADCVKGIRNDGGPYGPAGMYERTLVKLGVDPATARTAGEVLADKVNHRIVAIRVNVVATFNELRRRKAVREGLNPRAEKYLRVR